MRPIKTIMIVSSCFSLVFSIIGISLLTIKAKNVVPVYKKIRAKEKTNENINALQACKNDLSNILLSIVALLVLLMMVIINLTTRI